MQCFYKNVIYISIHSFRKLDLQRITNHEIYTILCKAFAQDDSGGEYVFLDDGNIGFISSEGEIGRIAESLKDLLILLIHIGNIGLIKRRSCRMNARPQKDMPSLLDALPRLACNQARSARTESCCGQFSRHVVPSSHAICTTSSAVSKISFRSCGRRRIR